MTVATLKGVPEPTLRRLPLYLHYLREIQASGRPCVSASHIGRDLQLDGTQVRKDLAATGIVGRPKIGFNVNALVERIGDFLGFNNVKEAFLVGAGGLGGALLSFDRFNRYGVDIIAAFDVDEDKINTTVANKPIFPLEKLSDLAQRMKVQVGIITTPAEAAQEAADLLVSGGVRAIWNFAPVSLDVPEGVIVQSEDLFASLAILSNKLAETTRVAM